MYVRVCKIYEDGRPIQRHRLALLRPDDVGWLVYRDGQDARTGRVVKRAWLLNAERTGNLYPPLMHANMETAENGALHIRGEETNKVSGKLSPMGWYCEIIDGRWHGQDSRGPFPV